MACKKILDETGETAMACKEIADLQTQLVGIQTRMLTALDPKTRVDELDEAAVRADEAAARADASVAQIDVQVDASAARIEQLEQQLAEQAAARADEAAARADASVAQIDVQVDESAARMEQLEQQLAEQAGASVARIKELEQQLKAAKAVASDAGGDKLIELLAELVASNKAIMRHSEATNACLERMEKIELLAELVAANKEIMRYSSASNSCLEKIEKKPTCCSIA